MNELDVESVSDIIRSTTNRFDDSDWYSTDMSQLQQHIYFQPDTVSFLVVISHLHHVHVEEK